MKKITILLSLILFALVLIPIIGNTVVKEALQKQIQKLESQGIDIVNAQEETSYLQTTRHYEFVVNDTDKFLDYLDKYSQKQLPPYTKALMSGTTVGVDLKYSNIPFSEDVSLDIYPLSLPDNMMNDLQQKDRNFSKYIETFLFNKGLLYHINYNLLTKEFDGYVKDVEEDYTLANGAKVIMNIEGTIFHGNGDLVAPSSLNITSKKIQMRFLNTKEEMSVLLNNFSSTSNFENEGTYLLSSKLDKLFIKLKKENTPEELLDVSKVYVNVSSNTQNENAELHTKISFDSLQTDLKNLDINASNLNYDVSASKMNKESFKNLRSLLSKVKSSNSEDLNIQLKRSLIDLLSKGIQLNIIDFSVNNIKLNKDDLKGFVVNSELTIKEDPSLAGKMLFSPLLILGNVEVDFNSKISKKILDQVVLYSPFPSAFSSFTNTQKEEVDFNLSYKQGNLKINGKSLLGKL